MCKSSSVADPGCFVPDPDQNIFSFRIPDLDPNIFFIPDLGSWIPHLVSYMKSEMQTYVLWFQEQSLIVSVTGIKIWDPGPGEKSSQIRIPDPSGKKAPDPGSRSATLKSSKVLSALSDKKIFTKFK
jgi:hypothetical protein